MPGQACDIASGRVFDKGDRADGTVSCVTDRDDAFANRADDTSKGLNSIQVRSDLRGRRVGNSALNRAASIPKKAAISSTRDQMSS